MLYLDKGGYGWEQEKENGGLVRERYATRVEFFSWSDFILDQPWAAFGCAKLVPAVLDKREYLRIIREWLSTCEEQHTCVSEEMPELPSRVLDLEPLKTGRDVVLLEISGEEGRYMTLSHCWGRSRPIETCRETIELMRRGIPWSSLPRTFQDAIEIAEGLDIRYLWIDSLCIIQDDTDDWERESSRMASIYANTYLNIAATSSGSSDGGCFKPRWIEAIWSDESWACPVADVKIEGDRGIEIFARFEQWRAHEDFIKRDNVIGIPARSPLLARAWVFQELYLSPRTIHFHASELVWECNACVRCECTGLEKERNEHNQQTLSRHRQLETPFSLDAGERLYFWLSIVNEYCQLNLTKESDRLPALTGLASRFADQSTGKYYAGLWEHDLIRMLLWTLNYSNTTTVRDRWPSWSWVSISQLAEPETRSDNSPGYLLVQGTSLKSPEARSRSVARWCTRYSCEDAGHLILVVITSVQHCVSPGITIYGSLTLSRISRRPMTSQRLYWGRI